MKWWQEDTSMLGEIEIDGVSLHEDLFGEDSQILGGMAVQELRFRELVREGVEMTKTNILRIKDLSKEEQKEFKKWLGENGCTRPLIFGVMNRQQDGYYASDYEVWKGI